MLQITIVLINEVRQAVMYILDKDNNGNITPDEYNRYAHTAQMEVFTEYFQLYNLFPKLKMMEFQLHILM